MTENMITLYSEEAEKSVLGAIILEPNDSFDQINERIKASDFHRQAHRRLYEILFNMRESERPIDLVTISDELKRKNILDDVGGVAYLTELARFVPATEHVEHYVGIIRDKAIRRELIQEANQLASQAHRAENVEQVLTNAQEQIQNIQDRTPTTKKSTSIKSIAMEAFEWIEERSNNKSGISGTPTGYVELDRKLSGLQNGDLIIVAARPSMGKTAFALNVAQNVALRAGKFSVVFSLEMEAKQLMLRMFSSEGNLDSQSIKNGKLEGKEWERLTQTIGIVSEAPMAINDEALTLNQIRSEARRLKRECGGEIGVIVIDYLQLIGIEGNYANQNHKIGEISRSLKLLAKELGCPIIALSQLSRAVEQRQEKRPMLSDLRESGSIEQDADVVMFLYRDDYYNEDSVKKNIAELIIAKHRNGPTGKVELLFLKSYSKFLSLELKR